MIILITGSRGMANEGLFLDTIAPLNPTKIIAGDCPTGADSIARKFFSFICEVYKADWDKHGKAAGPIRNKKMVDDNLEEIDLCVAFWDGKSKGTKNCFKYAERKGIKTRVVEYVI